MSSSFCSDEERVSALSAPTHRNQLHVRHRDKFAGETPDNSGDAADALIGRADVNKIIEFD